MNVIVGDHAHTRLEKPEKTGDTITVSDGEHAKDLGRPDIAADSGKVTSRGHRWSRPSSPGSDSCWGWMGVR